VVGARLQAIGIPIALDAALERRGSDVDLAFEQHGGVHEDLGNSGEGVLETVVEKKADKLIV